MHQQVETSNSFLVIKKRRNFLYLGSIGFRPTNTESTITTISRQKIINLLIIYLQNSHLNKTRLSFTNLLLLFLISISQNIPQRLIHNTLLFRRPKHRITLPRPSRPIHHNSTLIPHFHPINSRLHKILIKLIKILIFRTRNPVEGKIAIPDIRSDPN
ncbi:hypothetical protein Hanom_Chr02g00178171 [Helianthus anomalus]